jgi:hypothetical protein
MAPVLTLHHGDNERVFATHPTAEARRWLIEAAQVETGELADHLRRFADTLPARAPIAKGGE